MKIISDTLIVVFNSRLDEAGICVSRVIDDGKITLLKAELGEQAELLYRALTDKNFKIKEE